MSLAEKGNEKANREYEQKIRTEKAANEKIHLQNRRTGMKNTDKDYFERFSFGDSPEMADELLALVLAGKKTATVSVILEDEQAPSVGDLSLVLDGLSTPACVIKTVHVETVKFCDLTWDMVKLEGEDENFEQWKSGNIRYWTRDAAKRGYTFTDQTPITFERFEVVEVL